MKYRNLLFIFLLSVFASCSKDPELEPDTPPSTFKVRIDNVIHETYFDSYPQGPSLFVPYLVMSGLPEGEKLLAFGGYYSPENPNPDGSGLYVHPRLRRRRADPRVGLDAGVDLFGRMDRPANSRQDLLFQGCSPNQQGGLLLQYRNDKYGRVARLHAGSAGPGATGRVPCHAS